MDFIWGGGRRDDRGDLWDDEGVVGVIFCRLLPLVAVVGEVDWSFMVRLSGAVIVFDSVLLLDSVV